MVAGGGGCGIILMWMCDLLVDELEGKEHVVDKRTSEHTLQFKMSPHGRVLLPFTPPEANGNSAAEVSSGENSSMKMHMSRGPVKIHLGGPAEGHYIHSVTFFMCKFVNCTLQLWRWWLIQVALTHHHRFCFYFVRVPKKITSNKPYKGRCKHV